MRQRVFIFQRGQHATLDGGLTESIAAFEERVNATLPEDCEIVGVAPYGADGLAITVEYADGDVAIEPMSDRLGTFNETPKHGRFSRGT